VEALAVQPGGRYIDCTLGGGGHAAAILERSSPGGQLLGIDADPEAIKIARARLEAYSDSTLLINENFANLQAICYKYDFSPVHGILFDLGLSSLQLNGNGRGFSFQHDAPLDMRFNPNQTITAADIVNTYSETGLAHLIKTYGEEGYSHHIARRIVQERPIQTIHQEVGHGPHVRRRPGRGDRGRHFSGDSAGPRPRADLGACRAGCPTRRGISHTSGVPVYHGAVPVGNQHHSGAAPESAIAPRHNSRDFQTDR
ncbi:MAG: 16S rRNA (cytosine(1402)-N(4))-methyltransferase RsmH, partial [Chloroflexi bacterium]|nr:16S rRNA (cytosine(1402)-N(4))-methyltransferase RsmH [Chloroflexota bacterium]